MKRTDEEIKNLAGHPDAIPEMYRNYALTGYRLCEQDMMHQHWDGTLMTDVDGVIQQIRRILVKSYGEKIRLDRIDTDNKKFTITSFSPIYGNIIIKIEKESQEL